MYVFGILFHFGIFCLVLGLFLWGLFVWFLGREVCFFNWFLIWFGYVLVAVLVFVLLFVWFGGGFNLFMFCFRFCDFFFVWLVSFVDLFCRFVLPFFTFSCTSLSGCWTRTQNWVFPAGQAVWVCLP